MKTEQKLLILCLVFLMSILSSCVTVHEPTSSQPKMPLTEAIASMKEAIKATVQDPFVAHVKVVSDIDISEYGITLTNSDNTKRYYVFSDIIEPSVTYNSIIQVYGVGFKQDLSGNYILFTNSQSAAMFANALYYLKHTDIKQEREKERDDSLRRTQQTAIEEKRERDKKTEESLRLIRKTAIEGESGAAEDKIIPDSTTKRRRSPDRPTQQRKSGDEPLPRKQEGGSPPLPALPPGGAVSGH